MAPMWAVRSAMFNASVTGAVLNNRTAQGGPIYDSNVLIDGFAEPTFEAVDGLLDLTSPGTLPQLCK